MRNRCRRVWMGLMTVLGCSPRGFFIPYRYASQTASTPPNAFDGALRSFAGSEAEFRELIGFMGTLRDTFDAIGGMPPPAPRWLQDWFPGLDAAAAYAMVRKHEPRRIMEIGCGHSTRFFAQAVADGELDTKITAIDPAPRADLAGVGVDFVKATIQEASLNKGMGLFGDMKAGDILSIDSSHILMPGTDVDILMNRVFPLLPVGALIHIHDIFLPDDYPDVWAWRGYNEQLAVAALLGGGAYRPLWASHYVRTQMRGDIEACPVVGNLPVPDGAYESSLWIFKERVT